MNLEQHDEAWFTGLLSKVPSRLHPSITTMAFRQDFDPLFKNTTLRVAAYLRDRLSELRERDRRPLKTPGPANDLRREMETVFAQMGDTSAEQYVAMVYLLFAIVELGFQISWPRNIKHSRGELVSSFDTNFPCKAVIKQIRNIRRAA